MILFALKGTNLGLTSKAFLGCAENLIPTHVIAGRRRAFINHKLLPLSKNNACTAKYMSMISNRFINSPSIIGKYNTDLIGKPSDRTSSSSSNDSKAPANDDQLSGKDKLKRAVKDYGATVIIFHVTISLMSLGISYLVISSGVDVGSLIERVGISSSSDIAAGASTFVVAYALHKVFAPVRISITLGSTPFIVRYLRRIGILKPPKSQP